MFAGGPIDVSQSIVDLLVSNHKDAKVDTLGRGMTRYTSLNGSMTGMDPRDAAATGMRKARNEHIILLNGQDIVVSDTTVSRTLSGQCIDTLTSESTAGIGSCLWVSNPHPTSSPYPVEQRLTSRFKGMKERNWSMSLESSVVEVMRLKHRSTTSR